MFTGLVEEVGVVRRLERSPAGGKLSVRAAAVLDGTKIGDSIAVSGACLTVVSLDGDGFVVECMPETLSRTTLGQAEPGSLVNLERSLRWGDRLGGHLVLGHVDAVAVVRGMRQAGIAREVELSLPAEVAGAVAAKGSIAVDGISLTVMQVTGDAFTVGIIPHTLAETTLRGVRAGQRVNLEVDVLARYVLQALQTLSHAAGDEGPGAAGLTEEFLREQGFA